MSLVIFYVTFKDIFEAKRVCGFLLEDKLIACANFFEIDNMYSWEEKIVSEKEIIGFLKTTKKNSKKVESEIKKMHEYETPCIIKIDANANKDYENWIKKVTK